MENIIYLSLIEIFGDFELKKYARTNVTSHLYKGIFGYTGVIYFLIKSLKQGNIMYVNGLWDGMSGLLESIAAYVILGERLNHWYQYFGILMICSGIILLHCGGCSK